MGDFNPYQAPDAEVHDPQDGVLMLAGRGARLAARLFDGLTQVLVLVPGLMMFVVAISKTRIPDEALVSASVLLTAALVLGLLAVNCYCLHRSRQTLGKKVMGIKIVGHDGSRVSLAKIIGLRMLAMLLLELIPGIGPIVGVANVLMIFQDEQRCLHDRLAGTIVVQA